MDYLIADHHLIPEESERYYCEKVLRMPDGYVCYEPTESASPVGSLPLSENGFVTFGSFNNLSKLNSSVISIWAKILLRLPESRLILKYRGLGDESVRRRFHDEFAASGVDPQRIELHPPSSYADYLSTYHRVDLALDPFPFNGGATTCEALWMGVPVITCPGETFASRHSLSHLTNVGLAETIAKDLDQYVELAVALASDPLRLSETRLSLRDRMAESPLCNGKRFAENLLTMLRGVVG
jgi:predicted O-linked N-acetylglucosamine transferase (SPINDLY family)